MWLFDVISDIRHNRRLRQSGLEVPGEVVYTHVTPGYNDINPYSVEVEDAINAALEAKHPKPTRAERLRAERAAKAEG